MDVWKAVAVLVRRWYVAVPVLVLGMGLAGAVWATIPVQYESRAVLALTTPRDGGTTVTKVHHGWVSNPLANFDPTLNLTAGIVIHEMNTAAAARRLGVTDDSAVAYEVGNGSVTPQAFGNGPFIFVRGTGPTAAGAKDVAARVADASGTVLADRQRDLQAPLRTRIEAHLVLAPTPAEALAEGPLRAAALALAVAVLASLASAFGFESFALSRGAHRGGTAGPRGRRDLRALVSRRWRRPRPVPAAAAR